MKSAMPSIIVDSKQGRQFLVQEQLGSGGFAKCFRVIDSQTSCSYAAKVICKQLIKDENIQRKLRAEIHIHSQLNHPNIVKFDSNFEDDNNLYIILELCPNNTLLELVQKRKVLSEKHAKRFVLDIVEALRYIHSQNVIHRDIKLGNLFLDAKFSVKIGDFGLSTKILSNPPELKKTLCGTPNYIAPEIIARQGYSFPVDIWALGIVLYTILIGKPPFYSETKNHRELCQMILNEPVKFQEGISENAKELIGALLRKIPSERPSLDGIKRFAFFAESKNPLLDAFVEKENAENLANYSSKALIHSDTVPSSTSSLILNVLQKLNLYLEKRHSSHLDPSKEYISKSALPVHVVKLYDYSRKYGVFYELSNGAQGCFFNDHSCIISTNQRYFYLTKSKDSFSKYDSLSFLPTQIPTQLHKKYLIYFHVVEKYLPVQPILSSLKSPINQSFVDNFNFSTDLKDVQNAESDDIEMILKVLHIPNGIVLRSKKRLVQVILEKTVYLFIDELNWITVIKDAIVTFNGPFKTFPFTEKDANNFYQIRNSILAHG